MLLEEGSTHTQSCRGRRRITATCEERVSGRAALLFLTSCAVSVCVCVGPLSSPRPPVPPPFPPPHAPPPHSSSRCTRPSLSPLLVSTSFPLPHSAQHAELLSPTNKRTRHQPTSTAAQLGEAREYSRSVLDAVLASPAPSRTYVRASTHADGVAAWRARERQTTGGGSAPSLSTSAPHSPPFSPHGLRCKARAARLSTPLSRHPPRSDVHTGAHSTFLSLAPLPCTASSTALPAAEKRRQRRPRAIFLTPLSHAPLPVLLTTSSSSASPLPPRSPLRVLSLP